MENKLSFTNKTLFGALFGNVMEFYDFSIYVFFSKYIAELFFKTDDAMIAMILTFSVFASGYLSRPLGALVLGHIGDKYGRKKALVVSIVLITVSTLLIGLLPTYNDIGLLAPLLLVACRLLQGFSVSGEEGGAAVYLCEIFSAKQKGLVGALILGSAYFGLLLGSLTCLFISSHMEHATILAYGWRVPFLLSLILGVIAYYLRVVSIESMQFSKSKNEDKLVQAPVKTLFLEYPKEVILLTLLVGALAIPIYVYTVFVPSYLTTVLHLPMTTSLTLSSISLLFLSIGVPIFGAISDRFGYQKQMVVGCVLLLILPAPLFQLMSTNSHHFNLLLGAICTLGILLFFIAGPLFAILVNYFQIHVRFTGVSFVFNLSMSVFGSTTPLMCFYLLKQFHWPEIPGFYCGLGGLMGLFVLTILSKDKALTQAPLLEGEV